MNRERERTMKRKRLKIIASVMLPVALLLWLPVHEACGLGQRVAVIRMRAIASDRDMTIAQIDPLTMQQAYNYLVAEYPNLPAEKLKELSVYWPGIKRFLRQDAVRRETRTNAIVIRNGFGTLFPTVDIDWREPRTQKALSWLAYVATAEDPNDL